MSDPGARGASVVLDAFWPVLGAPRVPCGPSRCHCGRYTQQSYDGTPTCLLCAIERRGERR